MKNKKLVVALAVSLALGVAPTTTCGVFYAKHNSKKNSLYNTFVQSESYQTLKNEYTEIYDGLLQEQKITPDTHNKYINSLETREFDNIVFNYCLTHDEETANVYQEYLKFENTTATLLAGSVLSEPICAGIGALVGMKLEEVSRKKQLEKRYTASNNKASNKIGI